MSLNYHAQFRTLSTAQRGRFYLHASGLEAFGHDPTACAELEFNKVLDHYRSSQPLFPWVIGILWGKRGEVFTNFFGYRNDLQSWPGDPHVESALHAGSTVLGPAKHTGDDLVVLGREEEHRRRCRSLEHYLQEAPKFSKEDVKFCL